MPDDAGAEVEYPLLPAGWNPRGLGDAGGDITPNTAAGLTTALTNAGSSLLNLFTGGAAAGGGAAPPLPIAQPTILGMTHKTAAIVGGGLGVAALGLLLVATKSRRRGRRS